MSKKCMITGKGIQSGNNVSHANNRTRRKFYPNLQWKRIWLPDEKRFVRVRISTSAIRTLDKIGYNNLGKLLA